jgi:hypothetical protein
VLALAAPLGARAAGGAADAMAEALARMMQARGMLNVPAAPSMSPMAYMMPGMGSFGSGEMPWSQMPWGQVPGYGAFTDPIKAFGMPGAWQQMPMGMNWPWGGAAGNALDGIWEGRDGGLFIVRGQRFRLQAAQGGHIEGLVQRSGDRLALYEPSSESVKAYEIAMQQGRMVLRDERGQTYLYRRLWLDEPAYGAGASD